MKNIANFLAGVGSVLAVFGTAPLYHSPKRSDRSKDLRQMRVSVRRACTSLRVAADKAENKYGALHKCSSEK